MPWRAVLTCVAPNVCLGPLCRKDYTRVLRRRELRGVRPLAHVCEAYERRAAGSPPALSYEALGALFADQTGGAVQASVFLPALCAMLDVRSVGAISLHSLVRGLACVEVSLVSKSVAEQRPRRLLAARLFRAGRRAPSGPGSVRRRHVLRCLDAALLEVGYDDGAHDAIAQMRDLVERTCPPVLSAEQLHSVLYERCFRLAKLLDEIYDGVKGLALQCKQAVVTMNDEQLELFDTIRDADLAWAYPAGDADSGSDGEAASRDPVSPQGKRRQAAMPTAPAAVPVGAGAATVEAGSPAPMSTVERMRSEHRALSSPESPDTPSKEFSRREIERMRSEATHNQRLRGRGLAPSQRRSIDRSGGVHARQSVMAEAAARGLADGSQKHDARIGRTRLTDIAGLSAPTPQGAARRPPLPNSHATRRMSLDASLGRRRSIDVAGGTAGGRRSLDGPGSRRRSIDAPSSKRRSVDDGAPPLHHPTRRRSVDVVGGVDGGSVPMPKRRLSLDTSRSAAAAAASAAAMAAAAMPAQLPGAPAPPPKLDQLFARRSPVHFPGARQPRHSINAMMVAPPRPPPTRRRYSFSGDTAGPKLSS